MPTTAKPPESARTDCVSFGCCASSACACHAPRDCCACGRETRCAARSTGCSACSRRGSAFCPSYGSRAISGRGSSAACSVCALDDCFRAARSTSDECGSSRGSRSAAAGPPTPCSAHDCSADWTTACLQSTAAAAGSARAYAQAGHRECVLHPAVRYQVNRFSSAHVRKERPEWVGHVRHCVRANADRCIRRARLPQVRVLSV